MMNCNWLVEVAKEDRKNLRALGVSRDEEEKMDHKEVVAALKTRGYNWKKNPLKACRNK